MGKAVPNLIKTKCFELLELMNEAFNEDFEHNKKVIKKLKLPFSKKQINLMAGFITRVKKKELKEKAS